jgi:glycerol-3-phosphate cytidylyltransferase
MKITGYISGTFDLFHIGHLNIIKKAKDHCDYLIVGIHESGAWKGKDTFIPFKERLEIISAVKYVDKVVQSYPNDTDAITYHSIKKLFVGDDYKGTDRFKLYEKICSESNVEIVYFPYTKSTSSSKLRDGLQSFKYVKKK